MALSDVDPKWESSHQKWYKVWDWYTTNQHQGYVISSDMSHNNDVGSMMKYVISRDSLHPSVSIHGLQGNQKTIDPWNNALI